MTLLGVYEVLLWKYSGQEEYDGRDADGGTGAARSWKG